LYVSGMLVCTIGAEVTHSHWDHSVVFVKDKDVILISDYWQIIVNFNLSVYEDTNTNLWRNYPEWKRLPDILLLFKSCDIWEQL